MFRQEIIVPGQCKYDEIKALLPSIFPQEELVPEALFAKPFPYMGFFEDDTLVGFAQVIKTDYLHFLLYLAVLEQFQSKSYGGKALQAILADRGNIPLALNIEPLDRQAENYDQRVRRARFYQRNGISDSGYGLQFGDCLLSVYSTGESGVAESMKKLFDEAFLNPPDFAQFFKTPECFQGFPEKLPID